MQRNRLAQQRQQLFGARQECEHAILDLLRTLATQSEREAVHFQQQALEDFRIARLESHDGLGQAAAAQELVEPLAHRHVARRQDPAGIQVLPDVRARRPRERMAGSGQDLHAIVQQRIRRDVRRCRLSALGTEDEVDIPVAQRPLQMVVTVITHRQRQVRIFPP